MTRAERNWLVLGAIAIVTVSALMPFADDTTALIPMPYHHFVIYVFFYFGYLALLPVLFVLSYWPLRRRRSFGGVVLALAVALAALDAWWIRSNWIRGLDYPGEAFTRAVALENGIAFAIVIAVALAALVRRSPKLSALAHLLLFMTLGWCAFPLLGRFDL